MDFKKEVFIGLTLTFLGILLSIFYVYSYNKEMAKPLTVGEMAPLKLTSDLVARHNLRNDCWIIYENKVLDVTEYMDLHPDGPEAIMKVCGKDATKAFKSIKDGSGHSRNAQTQIQQYVIGDIEQ